MLDNFQLKSYIAKYSFQKIMLSTYLLQFDNSLSQFLVNLLFAKGTKLQRDEGECRWYFRLEVANLVQELL